MKSNVSPFSMQEVKATRELLGNRILKTPVTPFQSLAIQRKLGNDAEVFLKLELFQHSNSFKVRGAMSVALRQPEVQLRKGLTGFSSGNHAIALACVARSLGTTAKVVMQESANPLRRRRFLEYGGEAVFAPSGAEGLKMAQAIAHDEGRIFVHPYEGVYTTLGTATIALEINQQIPDLDAVVVAIGGGGLCSGLGPAIKQLQPNCKVFAVEPEGAATMYRSFQSGRPEIETRFNTIADALAPPRIEAYSFSMCRQSVDDLVLIDDQSIRQAMALLFEEAKLVVEPAGAAATAALIGPLRERLKGKRTCVIVCGSNIDTASFYDHLSLVDANGGTG